MSDKVRRGTRDRKQAKTFVSLKSPTKKRSRDSSESGSDHSEGLEVDETEQLAPEESSDDGDGDDSEDEPVRKNKTATPVSAKRRGRPPQNAGTSSAKKPGAKPKGAVRRRPGRKLADEADEPNAAKDTAVSDDNVLFNALLNPSAALQSTVEDFLDAFSNSPEIALADLINCTLRSCGCNASVDSDVVMDSDGIVDFLEELMNDLKKESYEGYPLMSKQPVYRKFRRSLAEFFDRLVQSAAELGVIYESDLMPTLQAWIVAMSSAHMRSFRHTATVIALEVETALCDVAAGVEKEQEVVSRQKEGEKKRKGTGATPAKNSRRDAELKQKAEEVKGRRNKLKEYLNEFFAGVFVHRYRDADPGIRADCVREIGAWLKKHPAHFLEGKYLQYIGWLLSDINTHVRLEAVKALLALYSKEAYLSALRHFTERFKSQLTKMATSDKDLPIRVAVIGVLEAIDAHGLLDDDQRKTLCMLIFDEELKVRKAVSGFVHNVWNEAVQEKLVGRRGGDKQKDKARAGVKCLATLLIEWSHALEELNGGMEESSQEEDTPSSRKPREIASLVSGANQQGRMILCVEALWSEIPVISEWETILDHLLLDHSGEVNDGATSQSSPMKRRRAAKNKNTEDDEGVEELWRLTDDEESVLVEVLLAALRKARALEIAATAAKKGDDQNEMTRVLINAMPRLFAKFQTDDVRIADILLVPQLMNLDMYLELRMITAYEALWDEVTKQFLSRSSTVVLQNSMSTVNHFLAATALSNTNTTKILELEDAMSSTMREVLAGNENLEVTTFSEDEVRALTAITARLLALCGCRDMTMWIDDDDSGKRSSAWDIFLALAGRGTFPYQEEQTMIEHVLRALTLHIVWKSRGLDGSAAPTPGQQSFRDSLKAQRDGLLHKLTEFATGGQSNSCQGVKRVAFQSFINLYVLFCAPTSTTGIGNRPPTIALPLRMEDQLQRRSADFVQTEIEAYAEALEELHAENGPTSGDETPHADSDDDDHRTPGKRKVKKAKAKKSGKAARATSDDSPVITQTALEKEYVFSMTITSFLRAIRAGAIDVKHSAVLLAHYDRLGSTFDQCSKVVIEVLKEEGMYRKNGAAVAQVVTQALRESFTLYIDGLADTDASSIALGKALSLAFAARGPHLSIVARLPSQHVVDVHSDAITWIAKRLGQYENSKNKTKRAKAVSFFRVLVQLATFLDGHEASQIEGHLTEALSKNNLDDVSSAKVWEPLRVYEKRLATAAAKQKGAPKASRPQKSTKSAAKVTTEDEDEDDHSPERAPVPSQPTPRRRGGRQRADGKASTSAVPPKESSPPPSSPENPEQDASPRRSLSAETGDPASQMSNGHATKKRRLDEDDEDAAPQDANKSSTAERLEDDEAAQVESLVVPTSDFKSRRKRVRR